MPDYDRIRKHLYKTRFKHLIDHGYARRRYFAQKNRELRDQKKKISEEIANTGKLPET